MSTVIGLDVGTSGARAIAVQDGHIRASAVATYPLLTPRPGWAEQDASEWKRAAIETLAEVTAQLGSEARDVVAIGLTGQMHGSVFLDASGEVIRPPLLWCDQRTASQCESITRTIGEPALIDMVLNPALTGFTAPKILWLRENEPSSYERVRRVLLPKDYIRLVLTGEDATDVADASGTLLFDVTHRKWHTGLMDQLGIPHEFMPRAFEGPEITGTLSRDASAMTGLEAGIPVVAGGGDQAAGGIGCGIVRPGAVSISVGTSGVVFAYTETPRHDPQGRVHAFCHAVPNAWHVMGVSLSAGGALRWFRDTLCEPEIAAAERNGHDAYDLIAASAESVAPGAEGLLFLPYLSGERTPHCDPFARGAFIGLSLAHTKAHMARAVLEGVAFALRESLDLIRGMGVPIGEIRVSGGGARSAVWRQIIADINGAPLVTLNVDEGPAYGAALLAAAGAGLYGSVPEACDANVQVNQVCEPDAQRSEQYVPWLAEYRAAYQSLAPGFRRQAGLIG